MNKLLLLNEGLVHQASQSTVQSGTPVRPQKQKPPVVAVPAWESDGSSLKKSYKFGSIDDRNFFLQQVLFYEQEKGHCATMLVGEKQVTLRVTTRDLGKVTELDREYSRAADLIYKETKDVAERRTSSLDE